MSEPARPSLSIVIAAYNERGRLGRSLEQIRDYAAGREPVEVIVVDDGSADGTSEVVKGFDPGGLRLRLLRNPTNMGKGYSVRRGMRQAAGEALLMTDADLSAPIAEADKLLAALEEGFDVAIGSRHVPGSAVSGRSLRRRLMAWAFRLVRRCVLLGDLRDTQCGFKLFRRPAGQEIFARQTERGFIFDCEILALAGKLGYRIKEVGVVWREDPDSRLRPVRDSIRMLIRLFRIRRRLKRMSPV
ncbi:MAG: hypothetical protein AMJ81_04330 [Phycisphaerae bacterium SM23_33]|nr:MAG: hypothetical protein AMJ81_04330 [Phycisphaerae bacterium SM23_33]